jgi:carbon monoxide dehydrogenase subunit G
MNRKHLIVGSFAALIAFSGVPAASAAEAREPNRYEILTPRSEIKAGGAQLQVRAPIARVRRIVTDFDSYGTYITRFEKVKVLGRHGDATDVYLQVPILKGAARIWVVLRFEPARQNAAGDAVVVVGKMLKGNMKRFDARLSLSKIDEQLTKLDVELLIAPDWVVPVPNSLVTDEAKNAAAEAVQGLAAASERSRAP